MSVGEENKARRKEQGLMVGCAGQPRQEVHGGSSRAWGPATGRAWRAPALSEFQDLEGRSEGGRSTRRPDEAAGAGWPEMLSVIQTGSYPSS